MIQIGMRPLQPLLLQLLFCSLHVMMGALAKGKGGGGGGGRGRGFGGGSSTHSGCFGCSNNNRSSSTNQEDGDVNVLLVAILVPTVLVLILGPACLTGLVFKFCFKNEVENEAYRTKLAEARKQVLSGKAVDIHNGEDEKLREQVLNSKDAHNGEDVEKGRDDSSSPLQLPEKAVYLATIKFDKGTRKVMELQLYFRMDDEGKGDFCNIAGTVRNPVTKIVLFDIVDGQVCLASGQALWVQKPVDTTGGGNSNRPQPLGADEESFVVGTLDGVKHEFTGRWTSEGLHTGTYSFMPRETAAAASNTLSGFRRPPSFRHASWAAGAARLPDHRDETTSQTATTVSVSTNADNFAAI